jgi:two-component system sensor histidine kinase KdpD
MSFCISRFFPYLWAILACGVTTLLALPARDLFDHANSVMLFLLTVLLVAWRLGRGPALLAAVLAVACFDVFFIPPYFSLAVFDPQYLVTFGVMLAVGLVTSHLTANLRQHADLAEARARESGELYAIGRELTGAATLLQVHSALDTYLAGQGLHGQIYLLGPDGRFGQAPAGLLRYLEMVRASGETVLIHALGDEDAVGVYLPLKGPMCLRGVLYIRDRTASGPALDALASLIAIAVERLHYVEVAQRTQVEISAERLRNSILSSLSHDLRTPLTALYGLADTLARRSDLPADAAETAACLAAQTLRMNHLLENLLDMARLRSGKVALKKEWQLFEDVLSASLYLLRPALAGRELKISLPPNLPLIEFDALLLERVLFNLIENAAKYSPAGSPIVISAGTEGGMGWLRVQDHGPGFPPDRMTRVFDMFVRGEDESSRPGVGLGLAIARAIIEAHGGTIVASNEEGAVVTIRLPLGVPPQIEGESA